MVNSALFFPSLCQFSSLCCLLKFHCCIIYQCIKPVLKGLLSISCRQWISYLVQSCLIWEVRTKQKYGRTDLLTSAILFLKTFRFGKVVWWWPLCSLSIITNITICCQIKPIPIHPYFICINTIIIINTVMCTFNIRTFNLTKAIVVWRRNN